MSIEIVVCPAFLPNLVRKITSRTRIDVDAAQALAATASPEAREAEQAHLRRYLATVQGAS